MAIPLTQLEREDRRAAKARVVIGMDAGLSWREAATVAGITTSEATAYRVRRRVRQDGATALDDHRHGLAYKLPLTRRQWLATYCQDHPHTPSHILQTTLRDRFAVRVSVGHLNQVRAALGVRYVRPYQEKKRKPRSVQHMRGGRKGQAASCS